MDRPEQSPQQIYEFTRNWMTGAQASSLALFGSRCALIASEDACAPVGLALRSLTHSVNDFDLSRDNFFLCCFRSLYRLWRDQILIVAVDHVTNTFGVEAKHVKAAVKLMIYHVFYDVVDGVIYALDHAGQDKAGLDHVL